MTETRTIPDSLKATSPVRRVAVDADEDEPSKAETSTVDTAPTLVRTELRPTIRVFGPKQEYGTLYVLEVGEIIIGRGETCDLVIADPGVSREHLKLSLLGGAMAQLEDLGSSNGTFVNLQRVERTFLSPGDRIQLGARSRVVFEVKDQSEVTEEQQLRLACTQDGLTGAYNKQYITKRIEQALATAFRQQLPVSLLMMDLDHFKDVNDTFGHAAGDEVLRHFAATVDASLRAGDVFARVGGEEFAVLADGASVVQAHALAERIRQLVEATAVEDDGRLIRFTVSLGVATALPDQHTSTDSVLRAADEALYDAKRSGRNRVVTALVARAQERSGAKPTKRISAAPIP